MTEDSSTININETLPVHPSHRQQQKAHPVLDWFTCTNLMSQVVKCNMCRWQTSGPSSRRKLEHVLGMSVGGVKWCPKLSDLNVAVRENLLVELETLDRKFASKKRNKALESTATMSISIPKR